MSSGEWSAAVVDEIKTILLAQRERWTADVPEDASLEPLWEAFNSVLTVERAAQIVGEYPEVLGLPGPAAVGDTLGVVISDVLRDALEADMIAWMDQEAGVEQT